MNQAWPAIALVAAVLFMALGLTTELLSVTATAISLGVLGAGWLAWWVRQPSLAVEEPGVSHAR